MRWTPISLTLPWLLLLLLPDNVFPQTTSGEQREETAKPPEGDPRADFDCKEIAGGLPSINPSAQSSCCGSTTPECEKFHNGVCKLRQDSGNCDYTLDICPRTDSNWLCTCCASCDGEASNNCKANGGHCRRSCAEEEVYAFWHDCAKGDCRCCKECLQSTCAEGKGICTHPARECPKGFFPSEQLCRGFNDRPCKCCVPCQQPECPGVTGSCQDKASPCPDGSSDNAVEVNCPCPDSKCRYCSRNQAPPTTEGAPKP
ncbi:scavenger receptor class F member 1-like isoform X2 [Macrobrachium nipponense]|uniref:scavenger receptor class F member 1-like isoform X2 n=1 Tax=Macrobrachium nipponense TaxID=159736 RepID=UPI0030C7BB88